MITHSEPDILECKVKWALGIITTNKAVEVVESQLSYFKSWKTMLWKCCTHYGSRFGKLTSAHRAGKGQFSFSPKECSNYPIIALISHASKVMLKILQTRLQQYVNHEIPDVQADFRKGRGTRDQIANIRWIIEKAREFQKNIYFWFIDYAKAFDCVDHKKLWKILKEMRITDHLTCLLRNLYAGQEATVRTGHETPDWFQIGKGAHRGCILSPRLFNYMQSTSWEMLGWMKHKVESWLPGEISITSDMQMTSSSWQKVKKN